RIAAEPTLPQRPAQQYGVTIATLCAVLLAEHPTERRSRSEQVEQMVLDEHYVDLLRLGAITAQDLCPQTVMRDVLERSARSLDALLRLARERPLLQVTVDRADDDEPIRILVRQRREQHRVHHAVDRR